MTCTFFGHRDCPNEIFPKVKDTVEDLILNSNVDSFLIGNQGNFDMLARKALTELKAKYAYIEFFVVLAYLKNDPKQYEYRNTIFPEGIENVPQKFAIDFRNKWMIEKSDYVITYITRPFGGAAKFSELALKKKKICINTAKNTD